MKKFKWLLNWSLQNIYVNDGDVIPVRISGKFVGECQIIIDKDKIIGNFSLNEDLDNSQYVLYTISTPNISNQMLLEGILLVDYYDGIDKRAKKVEDMFS